MAVEPAGGSSRGCACGPAGAWSTRAPRGSGARCAPPPALGQAALWASDIGVFLRDFPQRWLPCGQPPRVLHSGQIRPLYIAPASQPARPGTAFRQVISLLEGRTACIACSSVTVFALNGRVNDRWCRAKEQREAGPGGRACRTSARPNAQASDRPGPPRTHTASRDGWPGGRRREGRRVRCLGMEPGATVGSTGLAADAVRCTGRSASPTTSATRSRPSSGAAPNHLELALYAVMWSEHCSYKSSRLHLRRLPTEGPRVLVGPGENAGVIDAGDGIAVAIRIESHNHPSAIEPYQGAATGVGGILRDIFTMGARPIAVMDPLFFGPPDDARQRWLVEGVVGGISGYGNSVGRAHGRRRAHLRPAATPRTRWSTCSAWACCPPSAWCSAAPRAPGNLAVLLGSTHRARRHRRGQRAGLGRLRRRRATAARTTPSGRASRWATPSRRSGSSRPASSCSTPSSSSGIQDLGGAGLACATSETAARGGVGMDVDVSAVPRREPGMEPWEVMTCESQERMLAIVTPETWPAVAEVCAGGRCGPPWSARSPSPSPTAAGRLRIRDGFDGAGAGRRPGRVALRRRARSTTGRWPGRPTTAARGADDPGPCRPRPTAAPTSWRCCARPVAGSTASTTTSSSSTRWPARAATPRVLRLAGPGLPPSERGRGPHHRLEPDAGARSTRGPARR